MTAIAPTLERQDSAPSSGNTVYGIRAELWLPPHRDDAGDAVSRGEISARERQVLGYTRLPVSAELPPPDMAVRAVRSLGERTGFVHDDVDLAIHASIHFQGHQAWSPAHYIAQHAGLNRAVPMELLQQCNGGAMGIQIGRDHLRANPQARLVLVTTADRFLMPGWHRWTSDYGMAAGDGATAVLLSRDLTSADLHLVSLASVPAAALEVMHRGDDSLHQHQQAEGTVDVRRTKRHFIRTQGLDAFNTLLDEAIGTVIDHALSGADMAADDPQLRAVAIPRLGSQAMDDSYLPPIRRRFRGPLIDLGRDTGHLGAGDFNANLAQLVTDVHLQPGERALVVNGGGGFTFTAAVIEKPVTATDQP